jgi:hypothetical protein
MFKELIHRKSKAGTSNDDISRHSSVVSEVLGYETSTHYISPPMSPTLARGNTLNDHSNDPPPSPLSRSDTSINRSHSDFSLYEKYGRKEGVIGKGGHSVIKLCCPLGSSIKFAVKEFRQRRKEESQKDYVKKLINEFCISSALEHENVVKTIDLIQDEVYC